MGPWADRKQETSGLIRTQTFWGNKCPGGRQRKVGKGRISSVPNVTFCSLCSHYNKISLAEEVSIMYWCCDTSNQDWIKTKIPPLLRKVELEKKKKKERWSWGENQEISLQTSPLPMNILSTHFYNPYNQLAKGIQRSYPPECTHAPPENILLFINKPFIFLTYVSRLLILSAKNLLSGNNFTNLLRHI